LPVLAQSGRFSGLGNFGRVAHAFAAFAKDGKPPDDTDFQTQNGSIELFYSCKSVLSVLSVVRFAFFYSGMKCRGKLHVLRGFGI